MAASGRDPNVLEQSIDRLSHATWTVPFVAVPICMAICATPGIVLGPFGIILGGFIGMIVGFLASSICTLVLDWMMLMLVYFDNSQEDEER